MLGAPWWSHRCVLENGPYSLRPRGTRVVKPPKRIAACPIGTPMKGGLPIGATRSCHFSHSFFQHWTHWIQHCWNRENCMGQSGSSSVRTGRPAHEQGPSVFPDLPQCPPWECSPVSAAKDYLARLLDRPKLRLQREKRRPQVEKTHNMESIARCFQFPTKSKSFILPSDDLRTSKKTNPIQVQRDS